MDTSATPVPPSSGYVSEEELSKRLGVSRRTIKRMRKKSGFPAPLALSRQVHRFVWDEVDQWLRSRPRLDTDEPAQLVAARAARAAGKAVLPAPFSTGGAA